MSNVNLIAAKEFIARRKRITHPKGEFDNAGRFYLDESEQCECCADIRSPSRTHPFSQMVHARTLKHVCKMFDADEKEVRKIVKDIIH
tara:strand:+ start:6643 stop:6906 length:264 start_codon:yes stop_codon:yes gene_type:complete